MSVLIGNSVMPPKTSSVFQRNHDPISQNKFYFRCELNKYLTSLDRVIF